MHVYAVRGAEGAYGMLEAALRAMFEREMMEEADALFQLFDRE